MVIERTPPSKRFPVRKIEYTIPHPAHSLRLFLERTDIPPKKRCYFFFPGKIALILSIKPDLEAGIAPEGLGDSEDECGNCVEGGGVDCVASLAGCSGTVGFASPFAVGAE